MSINLKKIVLSNRNTFLTERGSMCVGTRNPSQREALTVILLYIIKNIFWKISCIDYQKTNQNVIDIKYVCYLSH